MKKINQLIAALAISAAAVPAFAAPETYNVDSTHTFARFSYSAAFVLVIPKTRSKSRMND